MVRGDVMSIPFYVHGLGRSRSASLCLSALVLLFLLVGAPLGIAQEPPAQDDGVALKLPGNPITDVLNFYEMLTGKRTVRDANLAGPNLTIVVPGKIPKADAIAMLESAMLLNGYTLVNVDDSTMKIIGPGRSPLGEGIPLYVTPESLPQGEQIVSYFMLFRNISTKDAYEVFSGYVSPRQQGKIVVVPNSNAIVITDNTPLIRRLITLQHVIDVPSSKVLTEFVPLSRASAEKVAELINKILEEEKQKRDAGRVAVETPIPPPGGNPAAAPQPVVQGAPSMAVSTSSTQVLADIRTNRILIVAAESRMPYLKKLVQDLDVAVDLDPPLTWPLRFVAAGEVLPVLQSILAEGDDENKQNNNPAGNNSTGSSSQSNYSSGDSFGGSSSSSGGGGTKPDKLKAPDVETAPIAVSVGKVRIIADRSANKIVVIGPPESKSKAASVLSILDQKPKQIYLATVIGELTLGKGLDLGVQYPGSTKVSISVQGENGNISTSSSASSGVSTGAGNTIVNQNGVDIVPGTTQALNSAFQLASTVGAPFLSGLSIYGIIGDSIDLYVKALQSTNNFRVISRPVVYTANNKKAVISSGQSVPVPETSLSSVGSGINQAATSTTVTYKDVVLKLEVIPLINSDNEVTLTIAQQNDNLRGNLTIADNTVPIVGTQELTTTVTVPNRHTVVLGGLITEEETISRTGLPFLSSIPVIGYAFGQKSKQITRRELIIMIQPFIINSPADEAEANYIETSMSGLNGQLYEDKIPVRRAEAVDTSNATTLPVQAPPSGWRKAQRDLSPMGD